VVTVVAAWMLDPVAGAEMEIGARRSQPWRNCTTC
jgi:hypothetical protein